MNRRLEVLLRGQPVGVLSERTDGGVDFRFLDSYRELVRRPVLGQKFEDDLNRVYRSRRGEQLPDFFANLIPEGPLRTMIEKAGGLDPSDDLALLSFVGSDLPGAVVVQALTDAAAEVVEPARGSEEGAGRSPETAGDLSAVRDRLRFSLAGVQLKFSMLLEEEKLTLPASDRSGEWIVKFDSITFPRLPENEFSMLEWARRSGFDVPECRLYGADALADPPRRYAVPGTSVLAVRRYDRTPEGRVHQEDFAQAVGLPPRQKYEQQTYERMANLVRVLLGDDAVDEFLRRLVFMIASGNNDAHLKNWSLVYPDRVRVAWSPLYDQVATVAWPGLDRALALKLAGVRDFGRIDRGAVERFAARAHVDPSRALGLVDDTLETLRVAWAEVGDTLPLPDEHRRALRSHWRSVPLLRAAGPLERE